jgi:hypothetical protein
MAADDDAVSPALGTLEPRRLARHELGELGGQALEIGWGRHADLRIDGECEQPGALPVRARLHAADVAHDGSRGANQVFGGKAILRRVRCTGTPRLSRRWSCHHGRVDNESACCGHQDALDAAATLPLFGELDESGTFERAQVVIDALATERELGGELRGGGGRLQPLEEPPAHGRQRQAHVIGLLEHGDRGRHG